MGNIKIRGGAFDTQLPLEHASVVAGFPSPADDYMHDTLDFNRDYIRHPEATPINVNKKLKMKSEKLKTITSALGVSVPDNGGTEGGAKTIDAATSSLD